MDGEAIKRMIDALSALAEIKESMQKEEPSIDEQLENLSKKGPIHALYAEMLVWAFGKENLGKSKIKMKKFSEKHPEIGAMPDELEEAEDMDMVKFWLAKCFFESKK